MTTTTNLANKAVLVSLSVSQWTANKMDKKETEEVTIKHSTAARVARVNKSLLPGARSLDAVRKATNELRTWFYANTLPWGNGTSIIKSEAFLAFSSELSRHKSAWDQAVAAFLADYPTLVTQAQSQLNGLYVPDDYPDVADIAKLFSLKVSFLPVPEVSDWRIDLGADEVAQLQASVRADIAKAQSSAMSEAWSRLKDVVEKAKDRLADRDAVFRDSLIDNIRRMCDVLPALNITDDPQLEAARREVEQSIHGCDPRLLRKSNADRKAVADRLAAVASKMGGFYADVPA